MLFWHQHDIDQALKDLQNFLPFPDEWNNEDKVLFEQAFSFHGKTFHKIKSMVFWLLFIMFKYYLYVWLEKLK